MRKTGRSPTRAISSNRFDIRELLPDFYLGEWE
jgi:hypothetical protein